MVDAGTNEEIRIALRDALTVLQNMEHHLSDHEPSNRDKKSIHSESMQIEEMFW